MSVFQSFESRQLDEAKAVGEVERLLEEHAKSRELATLACRPILVATDPGDEMPAPPALPELTDADKVRLGKIMMLIRGPHTKAVLKVVRRYMPDLFASEPTPSS